MTILGSVAGMTMLGNIAGMTMLGDVGEKVLCSIFVMPEVFCRASSFRDLCTTPLFVIPVNTGIQEVIDNTGYTLKGTLPALVTSRDLA